MRLFILGAAGSGKTSLCRYLRGFPARRQALDVVDVDDEVLRLNWGVWPDIDTKNNVVRPQMFEFVCAIPDVLVFDSYLFVEESVLLHHAGFKIVLLEVSEEEIRRRQAVRLAEEGWTNVEWFDWNQSAIQTLQEADLIDYVISGEGDVGFVAAEILRLGERHAAGSG